MSMLGAPQNPEDNLIIVGVRVRCLQHPGGDVDPITAILQESHLRRGVQVCDVGCCFVQLVHLNGQ